MIKKILSVCIIVIVALAMIVTNPGQQAHYEVMQPVMARVASQVAQEKTGGVKKVLKSIGLGNEEKMQKGYDKVGKKVAPAIVRMITVHDYLFFSIGKLDYEGTTYPVSFGIFGHVFGLPLDKVVQAMSDSDKPLPTE